MAKYKITYKGERAKKTPSEEIQADNVKDSGHEGEWIDFVTGGMAAVVVLRVRAGDVDRVERTN